MIYTFEARNLTLFWGKIFVRHKFISIYFGSLDSSRPYLVGQAGLGNSAEYGLLALGNTDNYCMGGPGVVLSRQTLRSVLFVFISNCASRLLSPHLESCLSHLLTTHEDVELGRCIKKHVGVSCTWNYEMQKLFHNNQSTTTVSITFEKEKLFWLTDLQNKYIPG